LCLLLRKKRKDKKLSLIVKYNRVLNKIIEQIRKDIKFTWRKLLDTELHTLYHLLDTLVKE
jgi:hypothetical protein